MGVIDVSRSFEIYQSDPDIGQRGFQLILNQNGHAITGTARQQHQNGQVKGDVNDTRIWMGIQWQDGKIGGYEGFIHLDQRLRGTAWELDYKGDRLPDRDPVQWWSADGYKFQVHPEPT